MNRIQEREEERENKDKAEKRETSQRAEEMKCSELMISLFHEGLDQGYSTPTLRVPEPDGFLFDLIINFTNLVSLV